MPLAIRALGNDAIAVCRLAAANILDHLVGRTDLPELRLAVPSDRNSLILLEGISLRELGLGGIEGTAEGEEIGEEAEEAQEVQEVEEAEDEADEGKGEDIEEDMEEDMKRMTFLAAIRL
jgi:hypothetical protein